jgi:hypothetical protein
VGKELGVIWREELFKLIKKVGGQNTLISRQSLLCFSYFLRTSCRGWIRTFLTHAGFFFLAGICRFGLLFWLCSTFGLLFVILLRGSSQGLFGNFSRLFFLGLLFLGILLLLQLFDIFRQLGQRGLFLLFGRGLLLLLGCNFGLVFGDDLLLRLE